MGHLVGDDLEDALAGAGAGVLGVVQEGDLTVGDGAPVLHRARGEVGQREVVELGQRVGNAEVVVEVVEEADGVLDGETPCSSLPLSAQTRITVPPLATASTEARSPTTKARR